MGYVKINKPIAKVIWVRSDGSKKDITNYIISITTNDTTEIQNNTVQLNCKLVKDVPYQFDKSILLPFYCNPNTGRNMLAVDNYIYIYMKRASNNSDEIDTKSLDDIFKIYSVGSYSIDEPNNKVNISGVDIQYKVINRTTSLQFRERYSNTTSTISGNTLTDSSQSFTLPESNKYRYGLKYMTLEVTDSTSGNTSTYLITDNDEHSITVHKTITEPSGSAYRIGDSSFTALIKVLDEVGMNRQGRGQPYPEVKYRVVMDYGENYQSGIQALRPDGSAFPIISIGEPRMPVFRLIKEISGFSACNTSDEMLNPDNLVIQRDMIFTISYNQDYNRLEANWFYPYKAVQSGNTRTITAVNGNVITLDSADSNDVGGLARITLSSGLKKSYKVIAVSGSNYTLSSDVESDGVAVNDTVKIWKSVDFIWDDKADFKHIKSIKLGGKDEEKYNHVLFDAGYNPISQLHILGHYFNSSTKSDTIKDVYIPMTNIVKNIIDYEQRVGHIKNENDTWYGWNDSTGNWEVSNWQFTTNFGKGDNQNITSRDNFNIKLRTVARERGIELAKTLIQHQSEYMLQGTVRISGQKFITAGSSTDSISQWYQKGTRILYKNLDSGYVNIGGTYFNLVVKRIRNQISSSGWDTFLDVEYSQYSNSELIRRG